jgi:hypothetical protein
MNSINMSVIVTIVIKHDITMVINYSVRIPKTARIHEHGWYTSLLNSAQRCTLSL